MSNLSFTLQCSISKVARIPHRGMHTLPTYVPFQGVELC